MKKLALIACVAILFAACKSETPQQKVDARLTNMVDSLIVAYNSLNPDSIQKAGDKLNTYLMDMQKNDSTMFTYTTKALDSIIKVKEAVLDSAQTKFQIEQIKKMPVDSVSINNEIDQLFDQYIIALNQGNGQQATAELQQIFQNLQNASQYNPALGAAYEKAINRVSTAKKTEMEEAAKNGEKLNATKSK